MQAIGNAMHRFVSPAHRDLLIAFRYVAVVDGGLRLTDAGRKRLHALAGGSKRENPEPRATRGS
jgi:hypothetical protein